MVFWYTVPMIINRNYSSTNYWKDNEPISIMMHATLGGTVIGAVDTLKARGLSYNYLIWGGVVYELVDWSNSAWHAGVTHEMNLRSKSFYGSRNPNKHSVGIAFVQVAGVEAIPEEDVDATVLLLKQIGQESGNRYNADNIFYHQEVTSYKPIQVKYYREQVINALVGDKDDKDAGEKTWMQLMVQLLQLRIKLLLLQLTKQRQ